MVMIVAAIATILFRQFKQPVVLGYILAGLIVGPHTPPFALIGDEKTIETLAELGIIFLMFALGLEFSLRKLQKVGSTAFIAASLEILLMVLVGYEIGRFFGWNQMDSVFLGAILSISSTTIIIKALEGLGKTKERFAGIIFGILIVEDILGIVMIALLSGFAVTGSFSAGEVATTILHLGAFLGVLLVVGLIAVPRLLDYVARFKSDEMLLVTVVGLCFGVSLITVKLGYSVALGAFLIGAIVAEARQIAKIETLMHPVRDLFSAVFFVSIGLLIDPALIVKYAVPIVVITIAVVLAKVVACSLGCFISGNDLRTSLRVGMGLAQIGEFSFIIASLGLSLKVTSDFLYPIAVAVSAVTTFLTPYLIRSSDGAVTWFDRKAPRPLLQSLEAYSQWVGRMAQRGNDNFEGKIIRKLLAQMVLNLLIITGIFIAAVFMHGKVRVWWPDFPGGLEGSKAAVWLAALLLSLPMLIAIWRKMEVGAMIISEMSVTSTAAGSRTQGLRSLISGVITVAGTGALILIVLALSSTILPSRNLLLLALLIVIVSGIILYRSSIKLYASAQYALHDTFAQPADPHPRDDHTAHLPPQANTHTIELQGQSAVIGKRLSELQLRQVTGANVVGIQRGAASFINPSPNQLLEEGDYITLIGSPEQIDAAKAFFAEKRSDA